MNARPLLYFVLLASLTSLCTQASANTVTIGANNPTQPNVYPFGSSAYRGEYQQVYNQADFSGPVQITSISFFVAAGYANQSITGSYILDLSTTSASTANGPGGLSTTYASNIGSNNQQFFAGAVSNILTFNGTPFLYNPAQGDLLLDVSVLIPNAAQNVFAAGCSADTNRIFSNAGTGPPTSSNPTDCTGTTGYGLQTQFTFTPVNNAVTPEPSTIVLLGTGLLGVAATARRRFRKV